MPSWLLFITSIQLQVLLLSLIVPYCQPTCHNRIWISSIILIHYTKTQLIIYVATETKEFIEDWILTCIMFSWWFYHLISYFKDYIWIHFAKYFSVSCCTSVYHFYCQSPFLFHSDDVILICFSYFYYISLITLYKVPIYNYKKLVV